MRHAAVFLLGLGLVAGEGIAQAQPFSIGGARGAKPAYPWCDEGIETIAEGVCHIDGTPERSEGGGARTGGGVPDTGRRTLVIFLHGAIAKDVDWQFTQERALLRQARAGKFTALFPRAPLGPTGYVWQLPAQDRDATEARLIAEWQAAQKKLEARQGRPFDEVFVMGFSSGAYFVGSLALRGRMNVDGYATFAGGLGAPGPGAAAPAHRAPLFVGVCAEDRQTAADSRSLASAAISRGIPVRADEQRIGHMFGDMHVLHAISFLRGETAKRRDK
jgi:predicted esterase